MSMQLFPSKSLFKRQIKSCIAQGLILFTLGCMPMMAMAVLQDEIQVYDDEINAKGESSLELHVNSTPRGIQAPTYPGEVMNNNGVRVTPEFAYGLGHDLEAGLYIAYVNYDSKFQYAATKLRLKWLPYREEKGDDFFAGGAEFIQRRGNFTFQYQTTTVQFIQQQNDTGDFAVIFRGINRFQNIA